MLQQLIHDVGYLDIHNIELLKIIAFSFIVVYIIDKIIHIWKK